jgi:hypothetical protein
MTRPLYFHPRCGRDYEYLRMTGAHAHESDALPLSGTGMSQTVPRSQEAVMISHRGSIIRAMVVFGSIGIAALAWAYSVMNEQRIGGSVEVEQLREPAWGVEVKEMSSESASDAAKSIVVAEP